MPVPVMRTWAAGETVTAAMMNTEIRDAVNWLLAKPYFHGYTTASQTLADSTPAAILLAAEVVDTINGHSTSVNTSRYTPNIAGKYRCVGQVSWEPLNSGQRSALFRKNGVELTNAGNPHGSYMSFDSGFVGGASPAFATIACNGTTDYIELWGKHNAGPNIDTDGPNVSFFIAEWIGQ